MSKMFDALRRAEAERKRKTLESEPSALPSFERASAPRNEMISEARATRDSAPVVPLRESTVALPMPEEVLSGELLRELGILRNSLESKLASKSKRVLMFTSGMHDEGVTTLAVAYCQLLAMQGHERVLLVELNARRPALAERLGLGPGDGVAQYFREARPIAGLVRHLPHMGFDVLRVGDTDPTHIQISLEKVFPRLREEALRTYDTVIIDAPPVVLSPETPPIAALVDGIVVVVLCGKSKRETVQRSINLLRQFNGQVLGVVLNRKRYYIPSFIYRRL
jgi:Mrp family chromosome partitioning ATPase